MCDECFERDWIAEDGEEVEECYALSDDELKKRGETV
jgi:hypothetical protein